MGMSHCEIEFSHMDKNNRNPNLVCKKKIPLMHVLTYGIKSLNAHADICS